MTFITKITTAGSTKTTRRQVLALGSATVAVWAAPAWAQQVLPPMTEGPFYPPERWRGQQTDWDADLTRVRQGVQTLVAQGEHLALNLRVVDTAGKAIDRVELEIWQCDTAALYRHPRFEGRDSRADKGFQGFGAARTNAAGQALFRTIKPVPYPGRTAHIHIKLRHPAFREVSSQLFVAGDAGNAADFIWRQLGQQGQTAVDMVLKPTQDDGLRWQSQHTVVVKV